MTVFRPQRSDEVWWMRFWNKQFEIYWRQGWIVGCNPRWPGKHRNHNIPGQQQDLKTTEHSKCLRCSTNSAENPKQWHSIRSWVAKRDVTHEVEHEHPPNTGVEDLGLNGALYQLFSISLWTWEVSSTHVLRLAGLYQSKLQEFFRNDTMRQNHSQKHLEWM